MQQLLPDFEASEKDLVDRAVNRPYLDKVELAVRFIQAYEQHALRLSTFGIRVADSYGKDSCTVKKLCEMAGVRHRCIHCVTGMDAPELMRFGRKFHAETVVQRPPTHMLKMMFDKGKLPPTRKVAWCCDVYKHNHGKSELVALGIRVLESDNRAKFWKQFRPRIGHQGAIINPIIYWTDEDVWRFIKENDVPYCELYDQGFKRLGCIGCPKNGKARIEEFKRYPKYEQMWHDAIVSTWRKWKDIPRNDGDPRSFAKYKSGEQAWDWWMENSDDGEGDCMQQEMDMNY